MPGGDGADPTSLSPQAASLQTQQCARAVLLLKNT